MFTLLHDLGNKEPANRLAPLVANDAAYCVQPEDRYKVVPVNLDRARLEAIRKADLQPPYCPSLI